MDKFKAGDSIQFLDELTRGVVLEVLPGRLRLRTDDGFEMVVPRQAVVRVPDDTSVFSGLGGVPHPPAEEEAPRRPVSGRGKKSRSVPAMEVDLHIEKLVPDWRGMSAYDILDHQLETARRQLEFALRKRIQRVVFIHGVGEGVLREELATLFRRFEGLRVQEADPRKYGLGATEVYIPQDRFY